MILSAGVPWLLSAMAFPIDQIRIFAVATGLAGLLTSVAPAQSRNTYGLNDLKPYAGTLRPQVSEAPNSAVSTHRNRPRTDPVVSLHAFGSANVESRIGH
jgi:hypothetical protein